MVVVVVHKKKEKTVSQYIYYIYNNLFRDIRSEDGVISSPFTHLSIESMFWGNGEKGA